MSVNSRIESIRTKGKINFTVFRIFPQLSDFGNIWKFVLFATGTE